MMKKLILFSAILFIAAQACRADNQGAVTLNMFNVKHGSTFLGSQIYIDAQNNFAGASFVPVEKTDSITLVPATGWTNKIAAEPGTLFIAYIKGAYYKIYVEDYIVRRNEEEKTTGDWFQYTTTIKRNTETLGVRINYQQLTDAKIEREVSANDGKVRIFLGNENNSVFINRIKTKLTKNGCVFTTNAPQSDFQLYLKATERQFNRDRDFVYCYVDVMLELFDTSAGESVYVDDFSQKGVSISRDRAVRVAVDDAVEAIGEKIIPLIIKNKE
jgi:hypothetical protein